MADESTKQLNAEVSEGLKRRFGAFCELHAVQKNHVIEALLEKLLSEAQVGSGSRFAREIVERATPKKGADVLPLNRQRRARRRR